MRELLNSILTNQLILELKETRTPWKSLATELPACQQEVKVSPGHDIKFVPTNSNAPPIKVPVEGQSNPELLGVPLHQDAWHAGQPTLKLGPPELKRREQGDVLPA